MDIVSLGLHLTDQCNARCQHCAYHCAPEVRGVMKLEEAKGYLLQVVDQSLDIVCISGGEPFLYFDLITHIVRKARELGVPKIWVFTNCYWAKNRKAAISKLMRLKDMGMTRLCLSASLFHQPFVPVKRVHYAIDSARELELEIVLDVRFLGSPNEDSPTYRATQQILAQLGDLEDVEIWQGEPLYIGRAADTLSRLVRKPDIPDGPCPGPWAGGAWEKPVGVDVDSYGEVTLCPGLSIGNAKRRPLSEILASYDPQRHSIIRELMALGPAGLLPMAQQAGYTPQADYAGECHLCYDVRKFLRSRYPSELAPLICYEEAPSPNNP